MINLFSFFTKKKENTVPSNLQNSLTVEEYVKLQDSLIVLFEKRLNTKIEKIRNGFIYLEKYFEPTQEDKFTIEQFLDIVVDAKEEATLEDYWKEYLKGFDYGKLKKWDKAKQYLSVAKYSAEQAQKKSMVYQWINEQERELFVLKLPNRTIQVPNDWLINWKKTKEDLVAEFQKKQEAFLKISQENTHTKRPRRKIGDNTNFDLSMSINQNLKDTKMGLINDACPMPNKEENYENKIRFLGGHAN